MSILRDDGYNQRLTKWFKLDKEAKKELTKGIIDSEPIKARGSTNKQSGGETANG